MEKDEEQYLCPSALLSNASLLLGIINDEGMVSYFGKPLKMPDSFVENVREGRTPEKRFRFCGNCFSNECVQWQDNKCSIGKKVKQESELNTHSSTIPKCGIRSACRWYKQEGVEACMSCKFIVTDTLASNND